MASNLYNLFGLKRMAMSKKKQKEDKSTGQDEKHNENHEAVATEQNADGNGAQTNNVEKEYQDLKDKYLRLVAEFDNYRKRTLKEKVDLMATASKDVIKALLPVLDDFDRAKKSAETESSSEVFSEGVQLVYHKLYKILEGQGVKPMESNGQPFDPDQHEAITEIPAPTPDLKGKVVDTVEKGYFLKDTIIRYAKVVVGK